MRKLKFRVWDIAYKMFLPEDIYDIHSRTSFDSFGIIRKDWKNYSIGEYFYDNAQILSQYTGVKDKNEIEIYEGDIVAVFSEVKVIEGHLINDKDYEIKPIMYIKGGFFTNEDDDLSIGFYNDCIEVIGNIYENIELL